MGGREGGREGEHEYSIRGSLLCTVYVHYIPVVARVVIQPHALH